MKLDYKKLAVCVALGLVGALTHYFQSVPTPASAAVVAILIGIASAMKSPVLGVDVAPAPEEKK